MITDKKLLYELIDKLPEFEVAEVIDFIGYLNMKRNKKVQDITLASEESLAKEWLTPEEDEAWENL